MIRTTYKGRNIKVLAARGKPHHRKMVINGHTIHHGWQGDDTQGLNWFKQIIDQMDAAGGPGVSAERLRYTSPTQQQRAGRQAYIDEYLAALDHDPAEEPCDTIYPEERAGYLGRPRCMHYADHRDALDPAFHDDHRGFRWPRKAAL